MAPPSHPPSHPPSYAPPSHAPPSHAPPSMPPPLQQQQLQQSVVEDEDEETTLMQNWIQSRAVVRVKQQGAYYLVTGVVSSVSGSMVSIDITNPTPMGIIEIAASSIEPVLPEKGDDVLVVGSDVDEEMMGKIGKLNNIDDTDAVVTVDGLGLQFFDMRDLCKYMPE